MISQRAEAAANINIVNYGAHGNDGKDDTLAIQAAINAANSGDRVFIPNGIYTISRTLIAKSNIKIQGESQAGAIVEFSGADNFAMINLSDTSNVELTTFTLDGKMKSLANGIFAKNGSGHKIQFITIQNLTYRGFGPHGILFEGNADWKNAVNYSLLADNTFSNIGVRSEWGAAIRFANGSSYNHALRNTIINTGRGGILANNGATDLIISENIITGIGKTIEGLSIEVHTECNRAIIEDNVVEHWISLDKTNYSAIRRNTVHSDKVDDWKYAGLELAGGSNNIFTDNHVSQGSKVGISISIDYPKEYVFWGRNNISHVADWGVQLQGDSIGLSYHYFYKNSFSNTYRNHAQSTYENQGHGFRVNGNSHRITLEENIISGNEGMGVEFSGKDIDQFTLTNNILSDNQQGAITTYPGNDLQWSDNQVTRNKNNATPTSSGFKNSAIPTADFKSPTQVEVHKPVAFINSSHSNNSGGAIAHVLWDLGQSLPSTATNPTYRYSKPGTYSVTLIVWDEKGRAARKEQMINVTPPR
ncbi:right-handed parallel beta-helix repeat-containing protein [Cellvibrio sp. PSBB023]|uniref:right-handed parallel beta-helix repeat-containing protein n=1 Tax=Cellvibrio sp. PSBB023 TaxID=1945512 RepID=UPI0014389464|nr:glycosyl hydrolase family 28-related protein [Cellvibrio sp. PSBB023]